MLAWDFKTGAPPVKLGFGRRPVDTGAHSILIVLDHVDHRQSPKFRHVKTLIDLTLIDRAVSEVSHTDGIALFIFVGKGEPCSNRNLRRDDPMPAVEVFLFAEHMHGSALAAGIAIRAAGQFGHHAAGVHAASQHMAMIPVRCNDLIVILQRRLDPDHDGFLANIEMAKSADLAHAVELTGLFFETADHHHVAIILEEVFS